MDGTVAINPTTGERRILMKGQWVTEDVAQRTKQPPQSIDTAQWPASARTLPNGKVVAPNGKGGVIQLGNLVPDSTEFAGKSAMFANLMRGAEGNMSEIEAITGRQARTRGDVTLGDITQFLGIRSPTDQKLSQAQNQWLDAMLRYESGATILDSERESNRKKLMPVPGDSPQVLAQKKVEREAEFQGMVGTSEGAYGRLRKQRGLGSIDGATGPLAGVSPIRRPNGPEYKPSQRPRTQYTPQQMQAVRSIQGGPRGAGGSQTNPTMVMNKAQFDKLPTGTWFIDNFGNYEQKVR
jgi:hypothetical protein